MGRYGRTRMIDAIWIKSYSDRKDARINRETAARQRDLKRDEEIRDIRLHKPGTPLAVERHQRKLDLKADERQVKANVKRRDGNTCRWPRCEFAAITQPLDCAHVEPSGMGGRPSLMREDNLLLLCRAHHRGPMSVHSGDLRVTPQRAELGTNGPCDFEILTPRGWEVLASEKTIGISTERSVR